MSENDSVSYEERKCPGWDADPRLAFREILELFDKTIEEILSLRSGPEEVKLGHVVVHRLADRDARNALVLKLTPLVSNLRAGQLLIDHGFTYEWALVRRLLYETIEDVMFLLAEIWADSESDLHGRFLAAFYAEDFDEQGRLNEKWIKPPSRPEIRSFLEAKEKERVEGRPDDGDSVVTPLKALYRFGSGHMHGRAASIMRLYDGKSRSFKMNGMDDKDYLDGELRSLWSVLHAATLCFGATRGQIWGPKYMEDVLRVAEEFSRISGLDVKARSYASEPPAAQQGVTTGRGSDSSSFEPEGE